MKKYTILLVFFISFLLNNAAAYGNDWPIYKGNIFFSGNNDEIIVKKNNVKWLFQAKNKVFNPVVSDGKVYFVDMRRNIYCVNEDTGRLIWRLNLNVVASKFMARSRVRGKIKYPLIVGNRLYISDNIAIYCINKDTGQVIWARTGMRNEQSPGNYRMAIVDGIYSNPVIKNGTIFYGTRNIFISRGIRHGHLNWVNRNIKTYSGFPSYYDKYIFTQSMDYMSNKYSVLCLEARTGKLKWEQGIQRPHKIFPPVVYKQKLFLPVSKSIYCLSLKDGTVIWKKDYSNIITSNPSFTDREILFTVGNKKVVMIDPETGTVRNRIETGDLSSPYYVTVQDQIYIASTVKKKVGKKDITYGDIKAIRFDGNKVLWKFTPPFPGAPRQPSASKGVLFVPAGKVLYAIGEEGKYLGGGAGGNGTGSKGDNSKISMLNRNGKQSSKKDNSNDRNKQPRQAMRKMKLSITDKNKNSIPAEVDIIKWDKGRAVYSKKIRIGSPNQEIRVPDDDGVEITINSRGYIPKKVIVSKKDKRKTVGLDRIRKGETFVVDNILFEFNESYLKRESLNILSRVLQMMRNNPRLRIEVRGHTDNIGTRPYNIRLSRRRADAVVEYLIQNGISPERLSAVGFGPDNPIVSNNTLQGRRRNRRTEFHILEH